MKASDLQADAHCMQTLVPTATTTIRLSLVCQDHASGQFKHTVMCL